MRKLSFRARVIRIAEPGHGVAIASIGLMLLIMFFDALGSLGTLPRSGAGSRGRADLSTICRYEDLSRP